MIRSKLQVCVGQALAKVASVQEFVLSQGATKLVFVGGAIAIISFAAYSFLKGDAPDEAKDKKQAKEKLARDKAAFSFAKKRRQFAEKKFFTEKDDFSDEASTSNQHEGRRRARSSRLEPHRFMSESEIGDAKSRAVLDTETKINEEADDLYFAMLNKLKA